jgi:catechol 2,3-dioxygenase-like lactoylglutathione lyase family enzyme
MLFDHVDLRVRSLAATRRLYDALLPAMGYTRLNEGSESVGYHRSDEAPVDDFIWVVEDADHRPNGTRIAFAAAQRDEVNRLAAIAQSAGAREFEQPALIEEYGDNYYAAFFEDPEGNKLEICCRKAG